MTSSDDEYGQSSNNHNNRRMNSNSNNLYSSTSGIEIRLLMTSRDAGAVIGLYLRIFVFFFDGKISVFFFRLKWFINTKTSC
jgi:hypothetical protein